MKSLLELRVDLKKRRELFNQYRIANISESSFNEDIEMSTTESIKLNVKGIIKEKIQEKVGEIKRFNRTMKQGYFNRSRATSRTYKAMI